MRRFLALAATLGLAGSAQAQPVQAPLSPPAAASVSGVVVTARRPTHLEGVTVTATDWCPRPDPARHPADHDPRVVDSYPRPGDAVSPGYAIVRVTFDAPMSCYSEVTVDGGGDTDPCQPSGTWELPDRRSWIMQCRLEPNARYRFGFRRAEGQGFVGLSGRTAKPYDLAFATLGGPATASPEAALRADPGPPGARRTGAYVICADSPPGAPATPCQHEVFRPPGG